MCHIQIKSKHEGVKYLCEQCDYKATRCGNVLRHIEFKHEGVKYTIYVIDTDERFSH